LRWEWPGGPGGGQIQTGENHASPESREKSYKSNNNFI